MEKLDLRLLLIVSDCLLLVSYKEICKMWPRGYDITRSCQVQFVRNKEGYNGDNHEVAGCSRLSSNFL